MAFDPPGPPLCVREDHTHGREEPANSLVSLDAQGANDAWTVAAGENDFYSSPKLSGDGKRSVGPHGITRNAVGRQRALDGELDRSGHVMSARRSQEGPSERVRTQPEWSPTGELLFISDRSDWWNCTARGVRATSRSARELPNSARRSGSSEFVLRLYREGWRSSAVLPSRGARSSVAIDLTTGTMRQVEWLYRA